MRRLLLILFVQCVFNNIDVVAQSQFFKLFKHDSLGFASDIIQLPDSSYSVVTSHGTVFDYQTISLIHIDKYGDIEWIKKYGDRCYQPRIINTSDGGYLITGKMFSKPFNGFGGVDAMIMKTDGLGNVLWTKLFGGKGGDGNILRDYAGEMPDSNYIFLTAGKKDGLSFYTDILVVKLNEMGDTIWTRIYGNLPSPPAPNPTLFYATGLCIVSNGDILVTGLRSESIFTESYPVMFRLDPDGNLIWGMEYTPGLPQVVPNNYFGSPIEMPDGSFMVNGYANNGGEPFIVRFNGSGQIVWLKTYSGITPFISTLSRDRSYNFTWRSLNRLLEIDSSGNILLEKEYYTCKSTDNLVAHIGTLDGGYAMLMKTTNGSSFNSDFAVIKTDSLGNSGVPCEEYVFTNIIGTYPFDTIVQDNIISGIDVVSATMTVQSYMPDTTERSCESDTVYFVSVDSICIGDNIQFTGIYSTRSGFPDSLVWDFGDPASGIFNSSSLQDPSHSFDNPVVSHSYSSPGNYDVSFILYWPCVSDTQIRTIVVLPDPTPFISGPDTVCEGEVISLVISGVDTISMYLWNTGDMEDSITILINSNSDYSVVVTNSIGCKGYDTISVITHPIPSIVISGDSNICTGDLDTLQGSGGVRFLWSTGDTTPTIIIKPTTDTLFLLTVVNLNGCQNTIPYSIILASSPLASEIDTSICYGNSIVLNGGTGTTFQWTPPAFLSNNSIVAPTFSPDSTITYTVIVGNGLCYDDTGQVLINVINLPTISTINDTSIDLGESIVMPTTGGLTYVWTPSTYLNDVNISNPISNSLESITYIVTGTDINGCSSSDTVEITVNIKEDFYVPVAFSPNGDGVNDLFLVRGLQGEKDFLLKIYDRWGNKVFESQNKNEAWDGFVHRSLGVGGERASAGVYVYWLNITLLNELPLEQKGNVTLIR